MEDLINQSSESLNRYFNTLSKFGYIDYTQVNKLLVLLLIEDIIEGDLVELISEEDYKILSNCLCCLYGTSCLIPYPEYLNLTQMPKTFATGKFKITEECMIKSTECDNIRST